MIGRDRRSARLDNELDRGADLLVDDDIHELGDEEDVDAILGQIGFGERHGLDSLIDGASADSLDFSPPILPDNARNRARYSRSSGGAPDFDHIHFRLPLNARIHVLTSFGGATASDWAHTR